MRGFFLLILCSSFILIVYYESTQLDTPFERFMDSQNFGVRTLFAGVGVVVSLFWDYHLSRIETLEPFRLAQRPMLAQDSILLANSKSPLISLIKSVWQQDLLIAVSSFAALVSYFLPILLSNIPFSPTLTWTTHQVCSWMSVGIIGAMMLIVVLYWVMIKYPHLPVDPGTVAGKLYYICDSEMLDDFKDTALIQDKDLVYKFRSHRRHYIFGRMTGVSGVKRLGMDYL